MTYKAPPDGSICPDCVHLDGNRCFILQNHLTNAERLDDPGVVGDCSEFLKVTATRTDTTDIKAPTTAEARPPSGEAPTKATAKAKEK